MSMDISPTLIEQYKAILGLETLPLAWSEKDLDRLGLRSVSSLRRDRVVGGGIPFIKEKGSIKYSSLQVLEWMQKNTRASTSE